MTDNQMKVMLIPKIERGIVIDHVPVGLGILVLEAIRTHAEMQDTIITLGLNYASKKLGTKDMLKVQSDELPERVAQHISLIAPGVSIKRIVDYEVDRRYAIRPPEIIDNMVRCRNPNCVTNHEREMETSFRSFDTRKMKYKCAHCERVFLLQELEVNLP